MWPPKRPLARMGSSRLTSAPGLMRENEVRFHVSSARSAPKESGVIPIAVRHTPLTAMLSPFFSSLTSCEAATVSRRFSFSFVILVTRPTSSMMPVNIEPPSFSPQRYRGTKNASKTILETLQKPSFLSISVFSVAKCPSACIRIFQVSLDCEVFAEAMQAHGLHASGIADAGESGASGQRDRSYASENLGCVIEKNFVHDTG